MSGPIPVAAVTPLAYADLPSRWGVTVERSSEVVRVQVPPVPSWRDVGRPIQVGFAALSAYMIFIAPVALWQGDLVGAICNGVVYGLVALAVFFAGVGRMRRRILFEIDADRFSIAFLTRTRLGRHWSWPRGAIGYVRVNPQTGKLMVQVIGVDLIELFVGSNRAVGEYVAETVAAALRDPPTVPRGSPPAIPQRAEAGPEAQPRWARVVLLSAGWLVLLAAAAMLIYPWPGRPLAFYVMILAGVPFGIVYGTQDKQYYV